MLAIMLVAAQKDFWHPDDATAKQLSQSLVKLVTKNGLPGSGHTSPNNPMWQWASHYLNSGEKRALEHVLAKARGDVTYRVKQTSVTAAPKKRVVNNSSPKVNVQNSTKKEFKETAQHPVKLNTTDQQETPKETIKAYELTIKVVKENLLWLLMLLPVFIIGLWFGTRKPAL